MNYWQGKNIRLRGIEPSDAEHIYRWNLDSERARHLDFVWPPSSLASVQAWAEEKSKQTFEKDGFHWLIEDADCKPVGTINTHSCSPHAGTFSYSVDITEEDRGRGYASEAILLILKYYFDELRYQKVNVCVHSNNPASINLHERLGFQREGVHRHMGFTGGQYFDDIWFGMTVEEFKAL